MTTINTPSARNNAAVSSLRAESDAPAPPPDLLDRIFAQWPGMERYRDTSTIEPIYYWRNGAAAWCWCVTITA